MSDFNCGCRFNCTGITVATSIIIGIIAALLTIREVITITPVFLLVAFGIAVLYLAIVFIASTFGTGISRACACKARSALLIGIVGTVLTSVILLAISFSSTSIIGAIITGLLAASFSLIIAATACLIKCETGCGEA